jgi:hypothetical protein
MSYITLDLFKNLRVQHTTWESLKNYLQSEDVAVSIREFNETPYAVLRYVKGKTNFEAHPEMAWARSVVWDTQRNLPVCIAPRKATPGMPALEKQLRVENFVDGSMINVFATLSDKTGKIDIHCTTRSQLDASGTFYSQKTFQTLFLEALLERNITSLKDLFSEKDMPTEQTPSVCMSFVLQHPEHRVVERVKRPTVYLVQYSRIQTDGSIQLYDVYPYAQSNRFAEKLMLSEIATKQFANEKEIVEYLRDQSYQRGWTWQGLVFKDTEGNRWRMRSNTYTMLRALRGSEASSELRFLRLRSQGKVSDYLKHYYEDRQVFWNFEQKLRQQTRAVYDAYIEVHKAHVKKLGDLENPVRTAVYLLHSHYLKDLRSQNQSVILGTAIELMNSLPHWQQAQFLKV